MNWSQWLNLCTASYDVAAFLVGCCFGAVGIYLASLVRSWND